MRSEAGRVPGPRVFFSGLQFFPGAEPSGANTGDLWHVTAGEAGGGSRPRPGEGIRRHVRLPLPGGKRWKTRSDSSVSLTNPALRVTYARFPLLSFVAAGLDQALDVPFGESVRDDVVQLFRASGVGLATGITYWSLYGQVQSNPGILDEAGDGVVPHTVPSRARRSSLRVSPALLRCNGSRHQDERRQAPPGRGRYRSRGRAACPPGPCTRRWKSEFGPASHRARRWRRRPASNARILGAEGDLGSIEEGKVADLLLLDAIRSRTSGNTRRIHAVIQGGRLVDREALLRPSN